MIRELIVLAVAWKSIYEGKWASLHCTTAVSHVYWTIWRVIIVRLLRRKKNLFYCLWNVLSIKCPIHPWKILHGHDHVDKNKWFSSAYVPGENERQAIMSNDPLNLKLPVVHTKIRRNFFSARVINIWNDIPYEIKSAGNLNIFKNKLESWLNSWTANEVGKEMF